MYKTARVITIINYVFSVACWLYMVLMISSVIAADFNTVGFFLILFPYIVYFEIISIIFSVYYRFKAKCSNFLRANSIVLLVTIIMFLVFLES